MHQWPTVVAGCGSPHGDDQAGWRLVELLQAGEELPVRTVPIVEPTQLFNSLAGCEHLIVVDACRSGRSAGSITRLSWPNSLVLEEFGVSSHGYSVAETLRMAEALSLLPENVEIYGIEMASESLGREMSGEVRQAVRRLCATLSERLKESCYA